MSEHYPRFRRYWDFEGTRSVLIRECVRLSFSMWRNHPEVVPHVMRALEVYRRAVGPRSLGWYLDPEGEWEPLDEQGWAHVRRKLESPAGANVALCQDPESITGYAFTYRGRRLDAASPVGGPDHTCMATFWLPTEFLEEQGPQRVHALALELAAELPFNSGHAGLCYLFPEGLLGVTRALREECFRYPGIDLVNSSLCNSLGPRVQGAHWLTFLGPPVLEALGGTEALRRRLHAPGTTVQPLDAERALVALGPWPEAGDLEQGLTLPGYRELARVLEPWLYAEARAWDGFSREDLRRWNRRFLD